MIPDVPAPDVAGMRGLAASLRTPELVVAPVRHHSPACAWHVARLIDQTRPCEILVEGPRGFTPLVPLLVHDEARMPLAIYTYEERRGDAVDAPRRAAYYPFCDHSPELVALRAAAANGIPAAFIDLDLHEQPQEERGEGEARSLLDERHLRRSRFLTELAARTGCRDHEELWEHLIEVPAPRRGADDHLAAMAAYCLLARLDCTEGELRADGTLSREHEMARHVRDALARREVGAGPVLAVVGGFHAVVLPALVAAARPATAPARASSGSSVAAIIRYSHEKLDRLNGYASGMTSPAWHQRLWEAGNRRARAGGSPERARHDVALDVLADVAEELRARHGLSLPVPALVAAREHVLRLCALRGRAAPVREDVLDAVTSCFVKGDADGDGAVILGVARRILRGTDLGRVPPGAPLPPLVRDFERRARRQRLKLDDSEPRRLVLDLYRRPEHRVTSRLLHGLAFLGVPFALRLRGPDFVAGLDVRRLREHWQYASSPATESALVEASVHGPTLPLAVASRFEERVRALQGDAKPVGARAGAALLVQACVLGLHDHVERVACALAAVIAADPDSASVASAAGALGVVLEAREPLEARGVEGLPDLLRAAYERACGLLQGLRGAPGDGAELLATLSSLRELLCSRAGAPLDPELYWSVVTEMRRSSESPLARGAACGLLHAAGRLAEGELAAAVEGHLDGMLSAPEAVAFVRGLLHAAREAAWQEPSFLGVLDRLLAAWSEEIFVAALPELRLAFASMTPRETDRVASAAAALHGAADLGPLVSREASEEDVQAHLALSLDVARILGDDGLGDWMAP